MRATIGLSALFMLISVALAQDLALSPLQIHLNQSDTELSVNLARLFQKAQEQGRIRVIVGLQAEFRTEGHLLPAQTLDQRRHIQQVQDRVLNRLHKLPDAAQAGLRYAFDTVPYLALDVDAEALESLLLDLEVISVQEDMPMSAALAQSTPLIGATTVWGQGTDGSGQVVAILDTGVDKNHAHFKGRVVSEACYSSNYGPHSATSLCPAGAEAVTGPNTGLHCTGITGCDHGTHVAGNTTSGVAPGAQVIAIQVFSRFDSEVECGVGKSPCVMTYSSDWGAGLERVYALRHSHDIAAANMSLGGGRYTSHYDHLYGKAIIDNLKSAGIATVIASGNDGYNNAISYPACISSAISVGSTTKSDAVSAFSNSAGFLDVLAPGSSIYAPVPLGGHAFKSGTSMAAPHVAGAWALLKQNHSEASVDEILSVLISTGISITDSKNSITKRRIRVDLALAALDYEPLEGGAVYYFNGDGKSDILWRDSSGRVTIWLIDGTTNVRRYCGYRSYQLAYSMKTYWTCGSCRRRRD